MGGFGSGSWYRWDSKKTTESQHRIDVRLLKKWGCLNGSLFIGKWSWSSNGEPTGSINYSVNTERIVLNYRYRFRGGEWESVEQEIYFDKTPCHYGGHRFWFLCPRCYKRVAVLYGAGKYFLCRHCHGLTYSSQQEGFANRMMRKARKIRERMDRNNIPIDPFPLKPNNMHWKTYNRLRDKAMKAEAIGWGVWEQRMDSCHAVLKNLCDRLKPN